MIQPFTRMPSSVAEKYSDDGGELPKYVREWTAAAAEKSYYRKMELSAMLVVGLVVGYCLQWLPIYAWIAVSAVGFAAAVAYGVLMVKSAINRMQIPSANIKMVDPLPDDHPSVYVVDTRPKPPSKKNGVETQSP